MRRQPRQGVPGSGNGFCFLNPTCGQLGDLGLSLALRLSKSQIRQIVYT